MVRNSIVNATVMCAVGMTGLVLQTEARACCLFNCFRKNSAPTTAYMAPVTTVPVSPATAASPAAGACGSAQCEQTVVRYVPQVNYQTVWQPVPVTTYRRTVSQNPATGLPITCTQPCTTYTYQARRVPYTTFRPVYATEPVVATAPAPAVVAPPVMTQPGSCGCNTTGGWSTVPSASTTAPYYTAPSSMPPAGTSLQPSTPVPSTGSAGAAAGGSAEWEPVQPSGSGATGTMSNGQTPANGATNAQDPADQRPRIPPAIDPNLDNNGFPAPPTDNSGAASSVPTAPTTVPYQVRPLPSIGAPGGSGTGSDDNQAPPLLNDPRNRTAVRPIRALAPAVRGPAANGRDAEPPRIAVQPATGNRLTSESSLASTSSNRRLDTDRIQLKRYDSDSYPPGATPAGTQDDAGWRSARR